MFAVIKTGGKQYKVAKNDVIQVEKLAAEVGASVDFDQVLMLGDGGATTVGTPLVAGATVRAEVLDQTRGKKIIVFKKKRRKNYRRTQGHRQDITVLRVTDIAGGAKKKAAKPAAKKAEDAGAATEAKPKPKKKAADNTKAAEKTKADAPAKTVKKKAPAAKAKAKTETAKAKPKSGAGSKSAQAKAKAKAKPKSGAKETD